MKSEANTLPHARIKSWYDTNYNELKDFSFNDIVDGN